MHLPSLPRFRFLSLLLIWAAIPLPLLAQIPGMVVDGQWDEWPAEAWHSDDAWRYAYTWDDSLLYLAIEVQDRGLQEQIMLCGLTVTAEQGWLGRARGSLAFPVGITEAERPRSPDRLLQILDQWQGREYLIALEQQAFLWQVGAAAPRLGQLPSRIGLEAALQWESGPLRWEVALPWRAWQLDPQRPLRLIVETGALGRPDLSAWDGVGIYGGNASNPSQTETMGDRLRQQQLAFYRSFTVAQGFRTKKFRLGE